jgi:Asp/Glu/hydantoin racemase
MQFYGKEAAELQITNLLDDGVMRFLASGDFGSAEARLKDMLSVARTTYGAELGMLTCSAVPKDRMERLRHAAGMPVFKIDVPMAETAVRTGTKIGVAVTFPRTLETATRLLEEAAQQAGVSVELFLRVAPEALEALLRGEPERHDELLLEEIDKLAQRPVEVIVLAQVSMGRILPKLEGRLKIPVLSSLETSLAAIRQMLGVVE